jgi:hypothetical protein
MPLQPPPPRANPFLEASLALDRVRYARLVMGEDPFPWQVSTLASQHKRKVIDVSRQGGKSTVVTIIPTHGAKYLPGTPWFVQAATELQAVRDMNKIKAAIGRDPTYPVVLRSSDTLIELDNGSTIEVLPATEKSSRGPSKPRGIIIDEGSRVEDEVIASGIIPMLNANPECELIIPSTPNGRSGFFFRAMNNPRWERYLVRSPYVPTSGLTLERWKSEEAFQAEQAAIGVRAWFSPRHADLEEQMEQLLLMGVRLYLQENCAEFVEPEEQVFSYEDIRAAAERPDLVASLPQGIAVEDIPVLE